MAPRKRARTSSAAGSSSTGTTASTTATTITLSGGESCPRRLVELWRSGQLTDTVVTVEGRSFDASKNVLASGSDYFHRHFLNEQMERGAANPTLQEHVSAPAFEPLLDFLYEGECTFDETRLTEVLQAANYLSVTPLKKAAVAALAERLSPSNALAAWSLADQLSLPGLAEAAKVTALRGFDEVEKIEEATFAQMQELVADDRLTTKSKEAVFSAVVRFAEAKQPAEAELLALLGSVRFAQMSQEFLNDTVRAWPMLHTLAGKDFLLDIFQQISSAALEQLSASARAPRSRPYDVEAILGARQTDEDGDYKDLSKVGKGELKKRLKKLKLEVTGDEGELIARLEKKYKEVGSTEVLVKWLGYSEEEKSWFPLRDLENCEQLVAACEQ